MRFRPIKAGLIVLLSSFGYFNFQSFGFCLFEAHGLETGSRKNSFFLDVHYSGSRQRLLVPNVTLTIKLYQLICFVTEF